MFSNHIYFIDDMNLEEECAGVVLGVLLLSVVANGLLLTGLNFNWQQVGTGLLILRCLP